MSPPSFPLAFFHLPHFQHQHPHPTASPKKGKCMHALVWGVTNTHTPGVSSIRLVFWQVTACCPLHLLRLIRYLAAEACQLEGMRARSTLLSLFVRAVSVRYTKIVVSWFNLGTQTQLARVLLAMFREIIQKQCSSIILVCLVSECSLGMHDFMSFWILWLMGRRIL